ncbi:hypothetical protein FOTG_01778 [Fusarium oxysporum f. sp. vasinfectum 25433]|uniref:DH domain-containing protein n=1 Tax=Fusarium oxysporum f. sp. vasinfectum 25433 TaxID=1089449 RepID=X0MPB4_FUSOX|nr:hypothetical protein FOTG_01778 [Fusarium oxysporum f. sp. vasinfectum 25433]
MSFRGDDQRRYGHVPPVQYPVAGRGQEYQQQQQQQQQPHSSYDDIGRRASFNGGDDAAYIQPPINRSPAFGGSGEDELFMNNNAAARPGYGSTNNALSGYQHQYQDVPPTPTYSYNPQSFAQTSGFSRSTSTNALPYRNQHQPQPPSRYASNASSYTPQAYDPSAYASTNVPQRQASYQGYNTYGQSYGSQTSPGFNQSTGSYPQSAASPALSSGFEQPLRSPSLNASPGAAQTSAYDQSYSQYPGQLSNGGGSFSSASQPPYPTATQMPVGPYYSPNEHNSLYNRGSRSNSQASPMGSPANPGSASPGLQRHPTNAPLPSRPVDDELTWSAGHERITSDNLMQELELELGGSGQGYRPLPEPENGHYDDDLHGQRLQRFDSGATTIPNNASRTTSTRTGQTAYEPEEEDDDAYGEAGLMAMRQAELDEQRFSTGFGYTDMPAMPEPSPEPAPINSLSTKTLHTHPEEQGHSSDSDFAGVDLGMLGGEFGGTLTYGGDVGSPPASSGQDTGRPLPTPGYFNRAYDQGESVPAFKTAEIDYGGTGGLQPPTQHRLSFDEEDERVSLRSRQSGTESPSKDELQDLFYHPGLSNRPLPAIPGPGSDSSSMLSVQTNNRQQYQHAYSRSTDSRFGAPDNPEAYYTGNQAYNLQPERSISLAGHSHTPQVQTPARSRTDAAEERRKLARHGHQQAPSNQSFPEYETPAGSIAAFDGITLPSGRKKKFIPSKLNASDFRRCTEPWALSGLETWIREMGEGEMDLRTKTIEEALINLFTGKIPMMNVADAEVLSTHVVSLMLERGVLVPDEEWVKFGNGRISGVLWQLTGSGCYAPKVHDEEIGGRCYSHHCTRTLKKVDLEELAQDSQPADEWHVFYGLTKADWESKPKKEVERQNILHEIVTGEENYIKQLDIFRRYYRDQLRAMQPPILKPEKRDKFLHTVFGKLDQVQAINKDHLLSQLKYRQQEQGPWIIGFSDLFREWIRKAKSVYIEYASAYPNAVYQVRREADRNILFKRFLDDMQKQKVSSKQDWTHYLIAPIQRLQRYSLLLDSVEKKMPTDSEEKTNLAKAIAEIRQVTLESDTKVEEQNKRVQMMELNRMLVLRPGFHSVLNLDHLGRELIFQGDLQRMGSKGVRWVDTHALLFDHYMILAKTVTPKEGKDKKYDVSKEPIPMPLLFPESINDEPVQKQKGITAPLGRTTAAAASSTQLNKVSSNTGRPGLEHAATNSSIGSGLTPTGSNDTEGKILYPFKVKHLGHEVYTLYASSAKDRADWCNMIIETKTRHAKALFSQNAEPFRLRVLADAAFHYDTASMYARFPSVAVKGTPLDRAIHELESVLGPAQGVAPVCRAQVNCATSFTAFGKSVIAIGTDYGVYISEPSNPRGWQRVCDPLFFNLI